MFYYKNFNICSIYNTTWCYT